MGRMENTGQSERMEKLCLTEEGNEQEKGNTIRVRSHGSFLSAERIGEGIEKKIIPLFPLKITFSFHSFHFEDLPSLPMMQTRKRGLIFATETKINEVLL